MNYSQFQKDTPENPKIKITLSVGGTLVRVDPASNMPSGLPTQWLKCFEVYKQNQNHSAVYGQNLGIVGGPDPYFYNPESPETTQLRPPEGVSMREFIQEAASTLDDDYSIQGLSLNYNFAQYEPKNTTELGQ